MVTVRLGESLSAHFARWCLSHLHVSLVVEPSVSQRLLFDFHAPVACAGGSRRRGMPRLRVVLVFSVCFAEMAKRGMIVSSRCTGQAVIARDHGPEGLS